MRIRQFNLLSLLLASHAVQANMPLNLTPGVTPLSHDIYDLHMLIFWICVAIGALVFGVMLYSILHHRHDAGYKARPFHEKLSVELTWTIVPLLILIVMAVPATKVLLRMNDMTKEDITIKITGYQWRWRYEYLNQGVKFFSNANTPIDQLNGTAKKTPQYLRSVDRPLVVPIHKKIRFLVTANDVIHSWWVPDLGVKRDAIPGYINEAWARIDRPGTYYGQCTELCGINHALMPIVVIAMSEVDFNAFMAKEKGGEAAVATPTPAAPIVTPAIKIETASTAAKTPAPIAPAGETKPPLEELMKKGEQIFMTFCSACHQANGMGMPPTFPALSGSPIVKGPVKLHLQTVLHGKPGTAMQAFKDQLTDDELASVITYERNSWGNKAGTVRLDEVKAARNSSAVN